MPLGFTNLLSIFFSSINFMTAWYREFLNSNSEILIPNQNFFLKDYFLEASLLKVFYPFIQCVSHLLFSQFTITLFTFFPRKFLQMKTI